MKSSTSAVDKRAPLSQYLRVEDEDGWTVFSSDDVRTDVEPASKPEYSPDLSVLKRIKNFLCDEAAQDSSFLASDDGDSTQNFRVDYPFYDSNSEGDDNDEASAFPDVHCSETPSDTTTKSVDFLTFESEGTINDDESEKTKAKKPEKSNLELEPLVLQAPENRAFCESTEKPSQSLNEEKTNETPSTADSDEISNETPAVTPTSELQVEVATEMESAENKGEEEFEATSYEESSVEFAAEPSADENAEPAPDDAINADTTQNEESAGSQMFALDFSETLAPVLERRARGEEIEEPPLVQTRARRSRSAKKEPTPLDVNENEKPDKNYVETPDERAEAVQFESLHGANVGRMAIFRRCVDLVSQRAKKTDVSTQERSELETPDVLVEPDVPAPVHWNDVFDYGESVAFVAAPYCYDSGVGASVAMTSTFG